MNLRRVMKSDEFETDWTVNNHKVAPTLVNVAWIFSVDQRDVESRSHAPDRMRETRSISRSTDCSSPMNKDSTVKLSDSPGGRSILMDIPAK